MAKFRDRFKLSLPEASQVIMSDLDSMLESHGVRPPAYWNVDMLSRAATLSTDELNLHYEGVLHFCKERQTLHPPRPPTWTDEPAQHWKLD